VQECSHPIPLPRSWVASPDTSTHPRSWVVSPDKNKSCPLHVGCLEIGFTKAAELKLRSSSPESKAPELQFQSKGPRQCAQEYCSQTTVPKPTAPKPKWQMEDPIPKLRNQSSQMQKLSTQRCRTMSGRKYKTCGLQLCGSRLHGFRTEEKCSKC